MGIGVIEGLIILAIVGVVGLGVLAGIGLLVYMVMNKPKQPSDEPLKK